MQRDSTPPLEAWFVLEVDTDSKRNNELFASIWGPFPTKERAEQERQTLIDIWEEALAESFGGENPYDFKGWVVKSVSIYDHELQNLENEDRETFERRREAASVLAAEVAAKEGIGPTANETE